MTAAKFDLGVFDELLSRGLCKGEGTSEYGGQVCIEQAISLACGETPTDQPTCALAASRLFAIRLNDSRWSSPAARAAGMRGLALAQIGTAHLDEREFVRRLAEATIREIVPAALRAAATRNPAHAGKLEAAAKRCEAEGTEQAARDARKIATAAATAYAAATAATAYAAYAAYAAAAYAACAATDAADAAAAYAACAATDAAARDQALTRAADMAAKILTEMRDGGVATVQKKPRKAPTKRTKKGGAQ